MDGQQEKLFKEMEAGRVKRVLLVRFGRIGENMFWTSVPQAIRAVHPGTGIRVLTNQPALWEGHPGVEEVLSFPLGMTRKGSLKEMEPILQELRKRDLDAIVVGKEPPAVLEMLRQVGVPFLVDREWRDRAGERPSFPSAHNGGSGERYHVAERAVLDAWPLGIGKPPWPMVLHVPDEAKQDAEKILPRNWGKFGILNVGTNQTTRKWPFRRHDRTWPIGNFIDCARSLAKTEDLHFLLSAHSPRERSRARKFVKAFPGGRALLPENPPPLKTLAALLQKCAFLVTCDTGILHIASSLGVPVVAIFGPRATPESTGPYLLGERAKVIVSGTREDSTPVSTIPGERVAEAVKHLF